MKKIDLEKNKVKYFHFTKKKNLESIDEKGLVPKIGDNSKSGEATPKVFFSDGISEVAKCLDVWVRWRIIQYQKTNQRQEPLDFVPFEPVIDGNLSDNDKARYEKIFHEKMSQFSKDMASGKLDTADARNYAYEDMYREWKDLVYLSLDLEEGIDFSKDDNDEAFEKNQTEEDIKVGEYMYGSMDKDVAMQSWNMHTKSNQGVPRDKILGQLSVNDKTDGISIAKEIFRQASIEQESKDFETGEMSSGLNDLRKWLKYVEEREKHQEGEQYYEWNISPDGKSKLTILGTDLDKQLVDAHLAQDYDKIKALITEGANPNVVVTHKKIGKKQFLEDWEKDQEGVIKETTLPILSQFIVLNKRANSQVMTNFIKESLNNGARFVLSGNQYVMPKYMLNQIENKEVRSLVEFVSKSSSTLEDDISREGIRISAEEFHRLAQNNIRNQLQGKQYGEIDEQETGV